MHLHPAVFIDRDGVLNALVDRGPDFRIGDVLVRMTAPFTQSEVLLLPHAEDALWILGSKGFVRVLVTNQPDVANGLIKPDAFERIMDIFRALPLDDLRVCPHRPNDGCPCRKPSPKMLLDAQRDLDLDLSRSIMIGDQESDVLAGAAAGVRTIRISQDPATETAATAIAVSFWDAVQLIP